MLKNYFFLVWLFLGISSCSFIGPSRSVEIISPKNSIEKVNLTPRHFRALEHCREAVQLAPRSLLASIAPLSTQQKSKLSWPSRITSMQVKQCDSFAMRGEILDDLQNIFASKSQRIGLILPPVSVNEPALQIIIDQLRKELDRGGFNPDQALIIRRVEKNRDDALKAAAELVHLDRVSVLVGGLNPLHASAITQMADLSQTPALIVNANSMLGRTTQTMRVYPPVKRLANSLIEVIKSKNVTTSLVLYPNNANLELFHLMKSSIDHGINFYEASYNPDDPSSVLAAVKSHLERISMQPAKVGVMIFDNFRMVRHIVNIVSTSLPGKEILYVGNQQWRSPALVVPRDDALQGAMFVDFIGSYRNLPEKIEVPTSDSEYFTTAQAASRIDFQVIGHRIASLAVEALRYGVSRHEIASRLQSMKNKWDSYFPSHELAFDLQRESSWPVFLFSVSGETIVEVK